MARGIKRVSEKQWERYKKIITDFIDVDAGKQPFLWLNKIAQPLAYGEDSGAKYIPTQLDGLFQYNYIRVWPTNKPTISGETDNSNTILYISANLLRKNRFLDIYGYWDFNWSEDRFILNGKVYKPDGDTQVAQASNEALLFFIILSREDEEESRRILETYANQIRVVNNDGIWLIDSEGNKIKDICNLPIKVTGEPNIPCVCTKDGVMIY